MKPARGGNAPDGALATGLLGLAALLAGLVVLQAAASPFWGDDYRFLYDAREAQAAGQPWWIALVDPPVDRFWRPLGEEMVWRFVVGPLDGDVRLAHALLLSLWAASALAMGLAAALAVRGAASGIPLRRAALAGALAYAAHGAHGLTLAWTAAANSLLANLLVALAVAGWLAAWQTRGPRAAALSLAALMAFGLGLLCREIAIVAPALAALLAIPVLRSASAARPALLRDLGAAAALAAAWWWLRAEHVAHGDDRYAMALGANVVRNGGALALFGLNVPRDALRFWIELREPLAIAWAVGCATLQLASLALFWRALPDPARRRWVPWLAAVAVVGAAPYFLLSEPGYPYYLGVSLLALAVLAAATVGRPGWRLAVAAGLLSGALTNGVEQRLPQPGLYARAAWAEASLRELARLHREHPAHFATAVVVIAADPRDFYAIGPWGLAVRTGRPRREVGVRFQCASEIDVVTMKRGAPPALAQCPPGLPVAEWPD